MTENGKKLVGTAGERYWNGMSANEEGTSRGHRNWALVP